MFESSTQKVICLSATEVELSARVTEAQDMLYVMRVIESMEQKVKKPMILEMDNKEAADLANNWSLGGRTRHVDVKQYFLHELKEDGLIIIPPIPGKENQADLFTKNLAGKDFQKHVSTLCEKNN